MKLPLISVLVSVFLVGCVTGDSQVFIKGFVFDNESNPIDGALVSFSGVEKHSDENGCFYFGGVGSFKQILVSISNQGFKPLEISTSYRHTIIHARLVKENTNLESNYQGVTISNETAWKSMGCSNT